MLNLTSIRKVSVNNKPYYLHTDILNKLPFFDDCIKDNNEEISITLDNVDDKVVEELFVYLYTLLLNKSKVISGLDAFKLYLFSDYFCIDVVKDMRHCDCKRGCYKCCYNEETLYNIQTNQTDRKALYEYSIQNNQFEKLVIFVKKYQINYEITDFDVVDLEIINKIKNWYYVSDVNYLLANYSLDIVLNIFETKYLYQGYEKSELYNYETTKFDTLDNLVDDSCVDFCKLISKILDISSLEVKKRIIDDILIKGDISYYYYKYKIKSEPYKFSPETNLYKLYQIDKKVENNNQ